MSGTLILVTILAYFGLLLLIAEFTARRVDNDAFFRGNRESPWYVVSFGMIGASLSGVTFVSVPGMVMSFDMTYMQTCIGFFFGYLVIAHVLLPLYYRLNLTSIYTYLGQRLGNCSYKTGASFFLLSKLLGAAVRLYLVCMILQRFVFDGMGVPFVVTVIGAVLLIWLYTRRSGIRTIVWTDSLQTLCMLVSMGLILWKVIDALDRAVEYRARQRIQPCFCVGRLGFPPKLFQAVLQRYFHHHCHVRSGPGHDAEESFVP